MFIHSVRVPRLYKVASDILKEVKEKGVSVKQLLYTQKKHRHFKAIYSLVVNTLEHFSEIEYLLEKSQLLVKETRFNPWIARILITELLWTKKQLSGPSKPIETILSYRSVLEEHKSKLNFSMNKESTKKVNKPRFVRVNTLAVTLEDTINEFKEEGWKLVRFNKGNYEEFVSKSASLDNDEFMIDIHIKELLLFPHNAQFYNHAAYKSNYILLQDKASCLPVHLLKPPPESVVLDMCAAPGMKTTYLAALLQNKGTIYAVEKDYQRFITLNHMIKANGATCVKTMNTDVLEITSKHCPNVEYILVDPSCTGSGMTERITVDGKLEEPNLARLQKLSGFQVMILKHALRSFPKAKRVVYSTCSIHSQENEYVVNEVLQCNFNFKLVSAKNLLNGPWKRSMKSDNCDSITENCIFTKPTEDLTNGFFIAVFERTESNKRKRSQSENDQNSHPTTHTENKKRKRRKSETDTINNAIDPKENHSNAEDNNKDHIKTCESKKDKKPHKVNKLDEEFIVHKVTTATSNQENLENSMQLKESKQLMKTIKNATKQFDIKNKAVKQKTTDMSEKDQEILTLTGETRIKKHKKSKKTHKKNINDNSNNLGDQLNDNTMQYNSESKEIDNFNTTPISLKEIKRHKESKKNTNKSVKRDANEHSPNHEIEMLTKHHKKKRKENENGNSMKLNSDTKEMANLTEAEKDKQSKIKANKSNKTKTDENSNDHEVKEVLIEYLEKTNKKKHKENESVSKTKIHTDKLADTNEILVSEKRKRKKNRVEDIVSNDCCKNDKEHNVNVEDKNYENAEPGGLCIKKSKKPKQTARSERGKESIDDDSKIISLSNSKKTTVERTMNKSFSNNSKEEERNLNIKDDNYENTQSEESHIKKSKKHKKAAKSEMCYEIEESMDDVCQIISTSNRNRDKLIDTNKILDSKKKRVEEIVNENYKNAESEELHIKKSKKSKKTANSEIGSKMHYKIEEPMDDDCQIISTSNTKIDKLNDTNQILDSKKKKKKRVEEIVNEKYPKNKKENNCNVNIDENYKNAESEELHIKKSKKYKKTAKSEIESKMCYTIEESMDDDCQIIPTSNTKTDKLIDTNQILDSKKKRVEEIENENYSINKKEYNRIVNIDENYKNSESKELHIKKPKKHKKAAKSEIESKMHYKKEESMDDEIITTSNIKVDKLIDTNQILDSKKKKKKKVEEIVNKNYENSESEELHSKKSKKYEKAIISEKGNETHNKIKKSMDDDSYITSTDVKPILEKHHLLNVKEFEDLLHSSGMNYSKETSKKRKRQTE